MPFLCNSYSQAWYFSSDKPPLREYLVLFQQRSKEGSWTVSITDVTGIKEQRIAVTTCLHEPTEERAELILRCYVDTDKGLLAFVSRAPGN